MNDSAPAKSFDEIVTRLSKAYVAKTNGHIEELTAAYETALADSNQRPAMIRRIAKIAHDMKGQGGSFGFPLMSEVAKSLGQFCRHAPNPSADCLAAVAAHLDAMRTVMAEDLRGDIGSAGRALLAALPDVSDPP